MFFAKGIKKTLFETMQKHLLQSLISRIVCVFIVFPVLTWSQVGLIVDEGSTAIVTTGYVHEMGNAWGAQLGGTVEESFELRARVSVGLNESQNSETRWGCDISAQAIDQGLGSPVALLVDLGADISSGILEYRDSSYTRDLSRIYIGGGIAHRWIVGTYDFFLVKLGYLYFFTTNNGSLPTDVKESVDTPTSRGSFGLDVKYRWRLNYHSGLLFEVGALGGPGPSWTKAQIGYTYNL